MEKNFAVEDNSSIRRFFTGVWLAGPLQEQSAEQKGT
jgi:hypothetical protein